MEDRAKAIKRFNVVIKSAEAFFDVATSDIQDHSAFDVPSATAFYIMIYFSVEELQIDASVVGAYFLQTRTYIEDICRAGRERNQEGTWFNHQIKRMHEYYIRETTPDSHE